MAECERYFLGNSRSETYHIASCRSAQSIASKYRIVFEAVEEAVAKGYVPCGNCNPPTKTCEIDLEIKKLLYENRELKQRILELEATPNH